MPNDIVHVGIIVGFDDVRTIEREADDPGEGVGINDLWRLFEILRQERRLRWTRLHITPNYFRQASRHSFRRHRLLYNAISDADQNPKVLSVAHKLVRANSTIPIVNPPTTIAKCTRERVADALDGHSGVLSPRTIRLRRQRPELQFERLLKDGVSLPIIIRPLASHTGIGMQRCETKNEVLAAFAAIGDACYATEYVDYRSPDGLYRKYRAVRIGKRVVFRHMIASDRWLIHAGEKERFTASRDDLLREERKEHLISADSRFAASAATLESITATTGLDYVGIDYSYMPNGDILVFEVNPTMTVVPFSVDPYDNKSIFLPRALDALETLVASKMADERAEA